MLHNFELCSGLVPFHTLTQTQGQGHSQVQADPQILLRQLNSVENIQGNNKNNSSPGRVASADCRVPFWQKGKWRTHTHTHTSSCKRPHLHTHVQIHACKSFCWRQLLLWLLFILTFLFYFHGAFCKHLWPPPRLAGYAASFSIFIFRFLHTHTTTHTHTHLYLHVHNVRKDKFLHIFLTFKNNFQAASPRRRTQHFVGLFCCAVAANLKRNSNVYLTVCVCMCVSELLTHRTDKHTYAKHICVGFCICCPLLVSLLV